MEPEVAVRDNRREHAAATTAAREAAMSTILRFVVKILPPTIHPMVVHFPIALAYLTLAAEALLWVTPSDTRRFLSRSAFWLLTAECSAIIVAILAGVVSEQSVHFTPTTSALLSAHQHYAVLTGLCAGIAWLARVFSRMPRGRRANEWSILGTGRGRANLVTTLFVAGAAVFITITGNLGGTMVYGHGVGIRASVVPAARTRAATRG